MDQKSNESQPGARALYEDGFTETWTASPGVNVSADALEEFVKYYLKYPATLVSVEIVEVPVPDARH